MIPDLKELVPSLYSKRKEREKEDFSDMDDDLDDDLDEETMERLEREMEDEYDAFQDYVDGICQVAEIEDSILTIDPEGWVGEER